VNQPCCEVRRPPTTEEGSSLPSAEGMAADVALGLTFSVGPTAGHPDALAYHVKNRVLKVLES
jgi:hypothetical protein